MNCRLPGSSVYADSSGKNTGVGCHAQQKLALSEQERKATDWRRESR